ncbi:KEOPS complex subunit Pcc1 [Halococcus saccharolyticus]|uniref:KEOPS complex Pcc1-like subunit n=1 Tax=Halococcus saccharolyticus DSM 5350 TaxID=1227455 RepID=M0MM25_9EURY|nr:KEOPS complex subunit Pcc1 [Halococcus saccharolyticus]EMA46716.1 KEOPS complex Pcc1-like subunit [Halococcus saccharolyticus DSM 5350]
MTERHETLLTFEYDTAARATTVEASLRPEIDDIEGDRTRASLARDGGSVEITIEAADLVALRAGQNTWLSLMAVAERCAVPGSK